MLYAYIRIEGERRMLSYFPHCLYETRDDEENYEYVICVIIVIKCN